MFNFSAVETFLVFELPWIDALWGMEAVFMEVLA